MNAKDAERIFSIKKDEIYELGKRGWSGITKSGREWIIPDDTEVLISVTNIRVFLYHLLRYKNNEGYVFPRRMCSDDATLVSVINQQYRNGLIGSAACGKDFDSILKNVRLTDEAIDLVVGNAQINKYRSCIDVKININPNINISLMGANQY